MFGLFHWRHRRLAAAPKAECPLCDGVLLQQARELIEAGYHVGAVATARCDLETRFKHAAVSVHAIVGGEWKPSWHTHSTANFLHPSGLLTLSQARRVSAALARAGGMVHNAGKCNCLKARWMVAEAEAIAGLLQAAMQRGLASNAA